VLGQHSAMTVAEAADGMAIEPDHVYVIAPNSSLTALGGCILVQDPSTARFDGMPRSAIAANLADQVIAPEHMPDVLMRYIRHTYIAGSEVVDETPNDPSIIDPVLALLRSRAGQAFLPNAGREGPRHDHTDHRDRRHHAHDAPRHAGQAGWGGRDRPGGGMHDAIWALIGLAVNEGCPGWAEVD
jgi:hypothetical protein